jgi:hypothetical protein
MGHDDRQTIHVIHSLDPSLQDLANAIHLDLQAMRVTPADLVALADILAKTKALLKQVQGISTEPPK